MPSVTLISEESTWVFVSNADYVQEGAFIWWIFRSNLRDIHRDAESQWFEPTPELEGDIVEVLSETPQANIALVKQEPSPPTEEEDEDEEED